MLNCRETLSFLTHEILTRCVCVCGRCVASHRLPVLNFPTILHVPDFGSISSFSISSRVRKRNGTAYVLSACVGVGVVFVGELKIATSLTIDFIIPACSAFFLFCIWQDTLQVNHVHAQTTNSPRHTHQTTSPHRAPSPSKSLSELSWVA